MGDIFRIYKKDETKVAEGVSPLTITGVEPETSVAKGDYQATRVDGDMESTKVDIAAFTTLAEEGPAVFNLQSEATPTNSNTLEEIKAWLTEHNIDFTGKTLKADLLALVTK